MLSMSRGGVRSHRTGSVTHPSGPGLAELSPSEVHPTRNLISAVEQAHQQYEPTASMITAIQRDPKYLVLARCSLYVAGVSHHLQRHILRGQRRDHQVTVLIETDRPLAHGEHLLQLPDRLV